MITLRRPVIKRCPYRDEIDAGELEITIHAGDAPELHALAARVDGLCGDPVSHEDFTRAVSALVPETATVTTRWSTGPWEVTVTTQR